MLAEPWRDIVVAVREVVAGFWRVVEQESLSGACSEPSSAVAGCGTCW